MGPLHLIIEEALRSGEAFAFVVGVAVGALGFGVIYFTSVE